MKKEYISSGRKNQKRQTRDKVLAATRELIEKQVEFTLEEVAETAGVSRATVYRYYSNVATLSAEAVLDMQTKNSELLYRDLKGNDLRSQLLEVQNYYNQLSLTNELAFRKYLGIVLNNPAETIQSRGGRRVETIKKVMEGVYPDMPANDIEKITSIMSLFMGIESLIVTKDVCKLTNEQSMDHLKWGLELLLSGFLSEQQKKRS
ncbi:TetR/AcrR family transcriptional regulator [Flavobacterium silvisoli]|uniref:TetR/AcrR family transcriptional regulator n=1 Tax=Flavobacterium silvisoli TaxID=2529433 RepID=A0A4Q9YV76_9FLAO|nr:TetR/AcrR family transcriptional regulator [Flavobacterium silvisoli]TBX65162.1 TetR/AcrR family transcriptional regulator [Flavobacterium silvisoli]